MNCRNSDLPDTAMAPSCGCGRSLSDISGPGPVVRPVANFCFDDNDPRFPIGMGYVPMMIYIILPQTFKIIAPQIGNTFVANITYIFTDPTVGKFFTHSYQNPKSA